MDILDVHIVRIISLDPESSLTLDTQFPCDHSSYASGYPKRQSWSAMVGYILSLFGTKFFARSYDLVADSPTNIDFPTPFDGDYTITLGFARSQAQVGVEVTNVTVNGFTITPLGENATVDIVCMPQTPLT